MADPAHRVAPHRLFLIVVRCVRGPGQSVARQDLSPVETAQTAQLAADSAVLHGDRVEQRQTAATLRSVSPAQSRYSSSYYLVPMLFWKPSTLRNIPQNILHTF